MSVDENIKFGILLDIYGELLSTKQKNMLTCYIHNDMSLAEIAENNNISRSAVQDAINTAKHKLVNFEQKLKLYELKLKLKNAIRQEDKICKSEIIKLLEEF